MDPFGVEAGAWPPEGLCGARGGWQELDHSGVSEGRNPGRYDN